MTPHSTSILEAIGFFSYFHLSPTALEVWKTVRHRPKSYAQYVKELDDLTNAGVLVCRFGHYALASDTSSTFEGRKIAFLDAMKKQKRWQRLMMLFRYFPGIEGIALCNLLPLSFTKSTSDIDFLILAKEGRVWTARFFLTTFLRLARLRPGEAKQHPIDASFFLAPSAYDCTPLFLEPEDPYFHFWLRALLPIVEVKRGVFQDFFEANRDEDFAIMPICSYAEKQRKITLDFGIFGEFLFKHIQLAFLPESLRSRMNHTSDIVVTDSMLKFHQNDRRKEIATYVQRLTLS